MGRLVIPSGLQECQLHSLLQSTTQEARSAGFKQLMCRAQPRETALIRALEESGWRLVDTLVTLRLDLRHQRQPEPAVWGETKAKEPEIRQAQTNDVETLMQIAREAFADREIWLDRFHADPKIPSPLADELYAQWVKNSVTPDSPADSKADRTFVATVRNGTVAGFLTCLRGNGSEPGKVLLNAVAKLYRGQGVYGHLVRKSLDWFREQGNTFVTVRTSITSLAVQKTWIRLGALPDQTEHTFHWWAQETR